MSSFDLTISFDDADYLNPQLYMMVDTLKNNIPDDTILHITTTRSNDDPVLKWIQKQVKTKVYKKPTFDKLKSRCKYMLHCFEIESDKDWVIKTEIDVLFLKNLLEFEKLLEKDFPVILQSENRRIIQDEGLEQRIWRNMYKAMKVPLPKIKLPYVENNEIGMPLLATGVVCLQNEYLPLVNTFWVPLTEICERWIEWGIHPNEFAFTAMIFYLGWDFKLFNKRYNFNPIGHFRKGEFPSTELIDNCVLPEDTVVFDYHRFQWLAHVAKYNPKVKEIIDRNKEYIPDGVWHTSFEVFKEGKSTNE